MSTTPGEPTTQRGPTTRCELSESAAHDSAGGVRDQAVTRVEQQLARLFANIRIGWREAAVTVHPELSPLGYQVLVSVVSEEATTAGEIIERLQVDKSVVSRHVRQLLRFGLVDSIRDLDDHRARRLVATVLAKERVALARAVYEGRMGERLRTWSPEDLDRFTELLGSLAG